MYQSSDLVRKRQKQNAVTAFGHFLSWATEFGILVMANVIMYIIGYTNLDFDLVELLAFLYPSMNLVVFPLVQMMSSGVLRSEARRFFKSLV